MSMNKGNTYAMGYISQLDMSAELESEAASYFQSLRKIMRCMIKWGYVDINGGVVTFIPTSITQGGISGCPVACNGLFQAKV